MRPLPARLTKCVSDPKLSPGSKGTNMPRTFERLTKARLLAEMAQLRKQINSYFEMDDKTLAATWREVFQCGGDMPPREQMIKSLIMSAIHYLDNVFAL